MAHSPRARTALSASLLTVLALYLLGFLAAAPHSTAHSPRTKIITADLNAVRADHANKRKLEHLLIVTPLKDASPYLDEYMRNIARLNYPKRLISLAFLVSDSTDGTYSHLQRLASHLSYASAENKDDAYESITILQKDFFFNLPSELRHGYELQPTRRSFMARARNYLLTSALNEKHAWVLWLDVDVIRFDPDILEDLMSVDKDIVVPNCLWHMDDWQFWGYDRNAWAETEESLSLLRKLGPDYITVEGYSEFPTFRNYLVDMPTHLGKAYVPLDGIGATFTLVKAAVHREGVIFPTYPFENSIETEGFAKMAKKAGFQVVGIPGIVVFHARNH